MFERFTKTRWAFIGASLTLWTALAGCDGSTAAYRGGITGEPVAAPNPLHVAAPKGAIPGELYTVYGFETREAFLSYGAQPEGPEQVKFVLTDFPGVGEQRTYWLDPSFYTLHDEWYWFRLVNGYAIPGMKAEPLDGSEFATVEEVYQAFADQDPLPAGLKWVASGERIYAPAFYQAALSDERLLGTGSVLRYAPQEGRVLPEELWLFELQYTDEPTEADLAEYFRRLERVLPAEVSSSLRWLVRSPAQQELADEILSQGGSLASRIVTYSDLVVEGAHEVYNPGVTAGQVRVFRKGELDQASLAPTDIVVLEEIPDYLPPVAGIITAVPQTGLAHINVLAASRGTPNIHIAGAVINDQLTTWDHFNRYVVMEASAEGYQWKQITYGEFAEYQALQGVQSLSVESIDLEDAPVTVDLLERDVSGLEELVPLVGGKAAHMVVLANEGSIESPDLPLAVSIRPFAEHVAPLHSTLKILFQLPVFTESSQIRFLALEGEEAFLESASHSEDAQAFVDEFYATFPDTSLLHGVVSDGGVRAMIEALPIAPETLAALQGTLATRFDSFSLEQGLRFRSSSTAEDIDGFNGAGLYESHTGYLAPYLLKASKQHKSVEWALKRTWSSYYRFEAFEERALAGIDHFSGNMGVLVHARFDDDLERSNGVFTLALEETPAGPITTLTLNAQEGALSVTNPPEGSTALPEVDVVHAAAGDTPTIERQLASTEVEGVVLSDEELLQIHHSATSLARDWLARRNARVSQAQRSSTLVLDFEFRKMAAGWPALADGSQLGERFIWKQVRTLDAPARVPQEVVDLPAPRDLLPAVEEVTHWQCEGPAFRMEAIEFGLNPALAPSQTISSEPFTVQIEVEFAGTQPKLFTHAQLDAATHLEEHDASWSLECLLVEDVAQATDLSLLFTSQSGSWSWVDADGEEHSGAGMTCTSSPFVVTPAAFLKQLLVD